MSFCPSCGHEVSGSGVFCSNCGQSVQTNQSIQGTPGQVKEGSPNVARPTKYCSACGSLIDPEAEICPKCGVRVKGGVLESIYQNVSGKPLINSQATQLQAPKYCQKCGQANDGRVPYCANCGEVSFASSPPSKISRPTGVTVLAIFQILISIVDIFIGLFIGALVGVFIPSLGLIIAIISFLPMIFGIALLTGRNWARLLAIVGAVFDLFAFPIGTIFGIGILYYLTRPRVVAYFKQPK